jgi:hypothetical protein
MSGEVGAVKPGDGCDHLLGRIPAPVHDDVVLAKRLGQLVGEGVADPCLVNLELPAADHHVTHSYSLRILRSVSER